MARIDVIMPQMGESIAEGTLSRWMKKVGESVQRDEPIFEISTDKVDAEIPAPNAGVLAEILVQERQTVAVQTVVARIETDASAAATPPAKAPAAPSPAAPAPPKPATPAGAPAAPLAPAPSTPPRGATAPSVPSPTKPAVVAAASPATEARSVGDATGGNGAPESVEDRLRRKSTPVVRKMAAEHNVDISAIQGTGLAGRVTKNDMLSYIGGGAGGGGRGSGAGRQRGSAVETNFQHRESSCCPTAPQPRSPAGRSLGRGSRRAVVQNPEAHRRSHGHVVAGLSPRQVHFRNRLHPHRAAPGEEETGIHRTGRQSHLSGVHHEGGGGHAAEAPGAQLRRFG